MRAFVAAAGVVFTLILMAHAARLLLEGLGLLREPVFVVSSLASLVAVIWSVLPLRRSRSSSK